MAAEAQGVGLREAKGQVCGLSRRWPNSGQSLLSILIVQQTVVFWKCSSAANSQIADKLTFRPARVSLNPLQSKPESFIIHDMSCRVSLYGGLPS